MAFYRVSNGGTTVYWSNPTIGYDFPAQTISLSKPCNKICIIWGGTNTSINVDAETVTNQYPAGGNQIDGVMTLNKGETKNAIITNRGQRSYTFGSDGQTVTIGASTYQSSYQTPALIFSLE